MTGGTGDAAESGAVPRGGAGGGGADDGARASRRGLWYPLSLVLVALFPVAVVCAVVLTAHTLFFGGPSHLSATVLVLVGGVGAYVAGQLLAYTGVLTRPNG